VRRATGIALGLAAAGAGGLTAALIRAGRRSGVTRAELGRALPGDDLVPGARVVMDRAVTLPAPPERVWPWLVQLGRERAGWYLPGWLERAVPRGRRSLRYLDTDFQKLAPGDEIPDWGPGEPRFRAMIVDPPRALVYLTARDREDVYRWPESGPPYPDSVLVASWALILSPAAAPGGAADGAAGSRLHLRLRINRVGKRAPWLVARLGGLVDEATVRPLFAGLAERLR
jgi:hypothetical protein